MSTTTPRRVDFMGDAHDFAVVVLGSLGFGYRYIGNKTGLTQCQISYRLRKAEQRVTDYRNGEGPVAEHARRQTWQMASKIVTRKLKRSGHS